MLCPVSWIRIPGNDMTTLFLVLRRLDDQCELMINRVLTCARMFIKV